jgi:hypothetical protein
VRSEGYLAKDKEHLVYRHGGRKFKKQIEKVIPTR